MQNISENKNCQLIVKKQFAKHFLPLLFVSFPIVFIILIRQVGSAFIRVQILQIIYNIFFMIISYPLMLGCFLCFFTCYNDDYVPYNRLFSFYKNKRNLITALKIGFLYDVLPEMIIIILSFYKWLLQYGMPGLFIIIFFSLFISIGIYFYFRLFLVPYIYVEHRNYNFFDILYMSFENTKGNIKKQLQLYLRIICLLILPFLMIGLLSKGIPAISNYIWMAILLICLLPILSYIGLTLAGLASDILTQEKYPKKIDKYCTKNFIKIFKRITISLLAILVTFIIGTAFIYQKYKPMQIANINLGGDKYHSNWDSGSSITQTYNGFYYSFSLDEFYQYDSSTSMIQLKKLSGNTLEKRNQLERLQGLRRDGLIYYIRTSQISKDGFEFELTIWNLENQKVDSVIERIVPFSTMKYNDEGIIYLSPNDESNSLLFYNFADKKSYFIEKDVLSYCINNKYIFYTVTDGKTKDIFRFDLSLKKADFVKADIPDGEIHVTDHSIVFSSGKINRMHKNMNLRLLKTDVNGENECVIYEFGDNESLNVRFNEYLYILSSDETAIKRLNMNNGTCNDIDISTLQSFYPHSFSVLDYDWIYFAEYPEIYRISQNGDNIYETIFKISS